nr:MAG TPA: hypothetical protein [Caudoviricetes sp.]
MTLFKKKTKDKVFSTEFKKELDYKITPLIEYLAKLAVIDYPDSVKDIWRQEIYNIFHEIISDVKINKANDVSKMLFDYIWQNYGKYLDIAVENVVKIYKDKNPNIPIKSIDKDVLNTQMYNYFQWITKMILHTNYRVTREAVILKLEELGF